MFHARRSSSSSHSKKKGRTREGEKREGKEKREFRLRKKEREKVTVVLTPKLICPHPRSGEGTLSRLPVPGEKDGKVL